MYGVAKELASILHPLVGVSLPPYQEYTALHGVHPVTTGECMSSYDVKALFTSVPVDPTLDIICYKLQQGTLLPIELPFYPKHRHPPHVLS